MPRRSMGMNRVSMDSVNKRMATLSKSKTVTMKRNNFQAQEMAVQAEEVYEWMVTSTTGNPPLKQFQFHIDELFEFIESGEQLCLLINCLIEKTPDCDVKPAKFHKDAENFRARENIVNFLNTIRSYGVPPIIFFEAEDLFSRKNDKQVITCLLDLSRETVQRKCTILPPVLVQYEYEIQRAQELVEQEAANQNEFEEVEVFAPQEYGLEDPEILAMQDVFSSINKSGSQKISKREFVEACVLDPNVKKFMEERQVFASNFSAISAGEEEVSFRTFLGYFKEHAVAQEVPALEEMKISEAKPTKLAPPTGDDFQGCDHLPYIPLKGDDIDEAVARTVNSCFLDVLIQRVAIKSKKGVRCSQRRHKGYYKIFHQKAFVRLVRGLLLVHVDNNWCDFIEFCQKKMVEEMESSM